MLLCSSAGEVASLLPDKQSLLMLVMLIGLPDNEDGSFFITLDLLVKGSLINVDI